MRINSYDKKENILTITLTSNEDLWMLETMLKGVEFISGWTSRIYKLGNKEERKRVFVTLDVEGVKFEEHTEHLRILGKIIDGKPEEFIQRGRYQTIEAGKGFKMSIKKDWKKYELQRIKESEKYSKIPEVLVILLDRGKAIFALLSSERTKYQQVIRSRLHKDDNNYELKQRSYFGKIVSEMSSFDGPIIIAGPGFTKDNIKNFMGGKNPELLKKISFDSCSYAGPNGLKELIKKGALKRISTNFHLIKEHDFIDKFMETLSKNQFKVAYGISGIKKAYEYGAINKLLVSYRLLRSNEELGDIVNSILNAKKDVIVVMNKSENEDRLDGFDGVMALLTFAVE